MEGGTQPDKEPFAPEVAVGAKPGEGGEVLGYSDPVKFAIDRELRLVSSIEDEAVRDRLTQAVITRYDDRVAKVRHDTRSVGERP